MQPKNEGFDQMKLAEKTAIVTGGSQGIGEAIARRYAAEGADVAIVSIGDQANAEKIVADIKAMGRRAKAYTANCSVVSEIEKTVGLIAADFGGIDILVNNAGVYRNASIEDTTEEIWDFQLDLNLKGTFFFARSVLPYLRKRERGKIINISSISGVGASPNCVSYCASKGGVVNLTRALAVELAPAHINVNSIAPGNVATPMNAHVRDGHHEDYVLEQQKRTPTGRSFMQPEDLTGAAVFLASADSDWVCGAILMVDDGWSA
jgi:NAD(P)-dependent dehydrogenase (short-subunit alcohol dehydrogenase family)